MACLASKVSGSWSPVVSYPNRRARKQKKWEMRKFGDLHHCGGGATAKAPQKQPVPSFSRCQREPFLLLDETSRTWQREEVKEERPRKAIP